MSYVNTAWITDIHCARIASKQDITESLALCDDAINAICQIKGVAIADIPTDDDGYITSASLIEYARMWLYSEILSNYWGSAHGENDIYYEKLNYYRGELARAEAQLTSANILNNSGLSSSDYIQQVVVY